MIEQILAWVGGVSLYFAIGVVAAKTYRRIARSRVKKRCAWAGVLEHVIREDGVVIRATNPDERELSEIDGLTLLMPFLWPLVLAFGAVQFSYPYIGKFFVFVGDAYEKFMLSDSHTHHTSSLTIRDDDSQQSSEKF